MSVQGISSSSSLFTPNAKNNSSSIGSDVKNLVTAIQSGDLKGAQNAFSQIQNLMQSSQGTPVQQTNGQQSQLSADLAAVGSALQAGDINGAQDALKKLGQDMQSTAKTHYHHHHHGGGDQTQAAASTTGVTAPIGSTSSSGSNVNVLV